MFRPVLFSVALFAALFVVPAAVAAHVHVRVEGKTRTIFGATQPVVDATSGSTSPSTALDALETAGALGEFWYHLTTSTFGSYVDQIGRYPAGGTSGWVFKVNGVSPPVGADQVKLADGDTVLWYWAQFGVAGGPPTLVLRRARRCYSAFAQDDNGKTSAAVAAVLHVGSRRAIAMRNGRACIGAHRGLLVRATMDGAVRSNALP